jgi:hypothetical protein
MLKGKAMEEDDGDQLPLKSLLSFERTVLPPLKCLFSTSSFNSSSGRPINPPSDKSSNITPPPFNHYSLPSLSSIISDIAGFECKCHAKDLTATITPPPSSPISQTADATSLEAPLSSALDLLVQASLMQPKNEHLPNASSPREVSSLVVELKFNGTTPSTASERTITAAERTMEERTSEASSTVERHEFAIQLHAEELWREFHSKPNEMIITKNGRCLFPILRLGLLDLSSISQSPESEIFNLPRFQVNPNRYYALALDIIPLSGRRLRFRSGKWDSMGAIRDDPETLISYLFDNADHILSESGEFPIHSIYYIAYIT